MNLFQTILAVHDPSLSYSYNLGRICGVLFLAAFVLAVIRGCVGGAPAFSGAGKYILGVLLIVAIGVILLVLTHRSKDKPDVSASSPPTAVRTSAEQPTTVQPLNDPELTQLVADARKQYAALEQKRTALNPKDAKAVQMFNQEAGTYQKLLARIEIRRKALLPANAQPPR